jgi:hypothetical protein
MHELYCNADLTITSLVASSSAQSLYQPRPRRILRPVPMDLRLPKWHRPDFKDGHVFEFAAHPEPQFVSQIPIKGPVHQRAWISQEHMMSARILYFGAGMLHWECLPGHLLESKPSIGVNYPPISTSFRESLVNKIICKGFRRAGQDDASHKADAFAVWQKQVKDFTSRKMTKSSDRIPAFLAISKLLEMQMRDKFVGGIWTRDHLLESLCWRLWDPDNGDPTAPTWTWASRSGRTFYSRHGGNRSLKASVVSCDAEADKSHSHISGTITLKGTLSRLQFEGLPPGTREKFGSDDNSVEAREDCCYAFDMMAFGKGPRSKLDLGLHGASPQTVRLLLQPLNKNEDVRLVSVFWRVAIYFHEEAILSDEKAPEGAPESGLNFLPVPGTTKSLPQDPEPVEVDLDWSEIVESVLPDREVTIV